MIFTTFINMFIEMAFYLMIGITLVGVFNIFVNKEFLVKHLGSNSFTSSILACLIGVPLPLCSCGVVPTGLYLKDKGASTATTTAFLISTPQTGVDSIIATYGIMGLTFAWYRPLSAFISGVVGGWFIGLFDKKKDKQTENTAAINPEDTSCAGVRCQSTATVSTKKSVKDILLGTLRYSYIDTINEISVHFLIGLIIAVLITVFIPTDFITEIGLNSGLLAMLLMVLIGLPMYICSTASIPIAVSFILKGISPGAAFVFLFAGPFTNAASLSILTKKLGKKITVLYLGVAVVFAMSFGLLLDYLISAFNMSVNLSNMMEHAHNKTSTLKYIVAAVFALLLIYSLYTRIRGHIVVKRAAKRTNTKKTVYNVYGMTCGGCSSSLQTLLINHQNVDSAVVDHETNTAVVYGSMTENEFKEVLAKTSYTTD